MRSPRLTATLAALALVACEAPADSPMAPEGHPQHGIEDHNSDGVTDTRDLLLWRSSFPGSGDLQIYAGTTTDAASGGVLLFDFANGSIIGRTSPSSGTPVDDDVVFDVIARTVDNQILDPTGNVLCEAHYGEQVGTYHLRDATGAILFTLFETLVFEGDAILTSKGFGFVEMVRPETLYSYNHDRIHEGWWPRGEVLATATKNIQLASPMRHLVIAAMIHGRCGSLGIP